MLNQDIEFSVIITCYYEEKSIDEFQERLTRAMRSTGRTFEIILVNDGSTDRTWERLKAIYDKNTHVSTIINLFRNTGQACAMSAGIAHGQGRHFIFMDSDLQLDPEDLPLLIAEFDKGHDIVSGYRKNRKDSLVRTLPSKFANMMMRRTARHDLTDFGCTFKIYDGNLIRAFNFGAHEVFKPTYVFAQAQRCAEVPVNHHERKYGKSGWTLKKLIGYYMDNLVGVSQRPFQVLSFICVCFSVLFVLRILLGWIVNFQILKVITPGLILNVLVVNLLVILAVLSAIGEYVIRNFVRLTDYPVYIIREKLQRPAVDIVRCIEMPDGPSGAAILPTEIAHQSLSS